MRSWRRSRPGNPGRWRPCTRVVFFDALRVKIRESGVVRNKAVYLALGILPDGSRDALGLWIENTEGARFWMKVFNDLRNRGVADILIAVPMASRGLPRRWRRYFRPRRCRPASCT